MVIRSSGASPLLLLLVAGVFMAALAGCTGSDGETPGDTVYPAAFNPLEQDPVERDSVLALLDRIDEVPFRHAFDGLTGYMYTRYSRTEQFNDKNFLVAFDERQLRYTGTADKRSVSTIASDSSGVFDYGFFRSFVSTHAQSQDPKNIAQHILPEDPSYLVPRNHEAYLYRTIGDTLMADHVARIVEIRALPESGDGLNIRRVRLYIEKEAEKLVAAQVERIDLAMFFREESVFFMHIRPTPAGDWLPYNTRFQTRIVMPFKPPFLYRTVASYYAAEPLG